MTACATGIRAAAPALVFHADGGHAGRAALGDQHAVRAEAGRAAHHRAEVARVGDRVERHDQRRLAQLGRAVEQVVGVGVLVRRDPRREALVHGPAGQPVELVAWSTSSRVMPALGGEPERLAQPAVALGALGDVHAR